MKLKYTTVISANGQRMWIIYRNGKLAGKFATFVKCLCCGWHLKDNRP